ASAPCSTRKSESEGPPCATSICPRTRSWRTMALSVLSRCSELSVRNSAKSSRAELHASTELDPLIWRYPVEFSGPTLTPGPCHRERYQAPAKAHRSNTPGGKLPRRMHCSMTRHSLRRPPAAVFLGQNGPDQPAEALGFLVMQIAGQAKGMAARIDELLQH